MLEQLAIQNFGLIDRLEVEFCHKLNVFTGETGAGKSIIIDALRCALGERMNSSFSRDTSKPCSIEAVFSLIENKEICSDPLFSDFLDLDEPSLIIKRSLLPDGRNKISINGSSVTVAQLKEIGNKLIDLNGPHDHQLLFSENSHLDIVDRLSGISREMSLYHDAFRKYSSLKKELSDLSSLVSTREMEMDTLSRRIKELEQVPLKEAAYAKVLDDSARAANFEKLYSLSGELMEILDNETSGISHSLQRALSKARSLSGVDSSMSSLNVCLARAQEELDSVLSALSDYLENLSFSPQEAAEINSKHDIYYDILRKYGPTIEDAGKLLASSKEKYALLQDMEHNTKDLTSRISEAETLLKQLAVKITSKRTKTAKDLKTTIEKELKDLGIAYVSFECRIEKTDFSFSGSDKISFYISPNAGEELRPLADIVSSGEAARVLLALKKALTKVDPVPCLVFDEIDAQIGGRLGSITGKKLKELSSDRQVILITHLPQIASFADRHIKVQKEVASGRTSVTVSTLEGKEKTDELAKMMSGAQKSKIAQDLAEDMLQKAKK